MSTLKWHRNVTTASRLLILLCTSNCNRNNSTIYSQSASVCFFWNVRKQNPRWHSHTLLTGLLSQPRALPVQCHTWNENLNIREVNFRLHNFNAAKTLANNIHDVNNTWSRLLPSDPSLWSPSPYFKNPGSSSPCNLTYRVNSRLLSKLASACERMETHKQASSKPCTFHEYKSKAMKHTRRGNISWKYSLTVVLV
jgi:hypothetical protein